MIQDAVDAAESGDTILLGPGRFPETVDFDYYNGRTIQTCISLDKSLVFVGSGVNQTFIGPTNGKTEYGTYGLASRSSNLDLEIRDLTFIDCDGFTILFDMDTGGQLSVENISTENCFGGIGLIGTFGGSIRNCSFNNLEHNGITIFEGGDGIVIENCFFSGGAAQINIAFPESRNITISDCVLENGLYGIILNDCGPVTIRSCEMENHRVVGISVGATTGVSIEDCIIMSHAQGESIRMLNNQYLIVQNNILEGGFGAITVLSPSPNMDFSNNHILKSPDGYSIWVSQNYSGPATNLDFTNNYWGTNDPEEVADSILDGFDSDDIDMYVLFEPMADGPISTESTTWDELKSLYR